MSFEPRDYLRHILVEADYLIDRSADLSYDTLASDETLRRAFVRSLEIVGEALQILECPSSTQRSFGSRRPSSSARWSRRLTICLSTVQRK